MVRRGWHQLDVPTGWLKIFVALVPRRRSGQQHLRTNRDHQIQAEGDGDEFHNQEVFTNPPAVAFARSPVHPCIQEHGSCHHPRQPSRVPEVVVAEAAEEVRRLEAAVSALGEENGHAKPLLKALDVAREISRLALVDKKMELCNIF